jgi:hypothetical protein
MTLLAYRKFFPSCAWRANMKVGEVEVQRFGMPPAGKSLLGEFGLAMHLESRRGNETRNMLLDFGFTPETLNNNLRMLGIVPEGIGRADSEPRPLRPFRRPSRLPPTAPRPAPGRSFPVSGRGRMLLHARMDHR